VPQWDARMGADQLFKAHRSFGLTLEEFEGPRYRRIGHVKKTAFSTFSPYVTTNASSAIAVSGS
jgi:hypothetical protein